MKNLIPKLIITTVIIFFTIFSCKKSQDSNLTFKELDSKLVEKVVEKYNLKEFYEKTQEKEQILIINLLKSSSSFYKEVSSELDIQSTRKTSRNDDNIVIYSIPFKGNTERMLVLKNQIIGDVQVKIAEFLLDRTLESDEVGFIRTKTNKNEVFLTNFNSGFKEIKNINSKNDSGTIKTFSTDCAGNHGGTGFCQREPNEKISDCYKAEVDEFCSDFASCAGLLYWQVHILILGSCSCSATQCPN